MTKETVGLKDFIAKVIEDVHEGVNAGKRKVHEPMCCGSESTHIDFDLAITSTMDKSSGTNGQIGVQVLDWFKVQASGKSEKGTIISQANRIHFTIPLVLRENTETSNDTGTGFEPLDNEAGY